LVPDRLADRRFGGGHQRVSSSNNDDTTRSAKVAMMIVPTTATTPIAEAKLDGNKVIFTVTEKDIKATGEKPATFTMGALGAEVRTSTGAATVPSWDAIDPDDTKSFSPCK